MVRRVSLAFVPLLAFAGWAAAQTYTNFESSHVHPIALTPSGQRLVAVNTPDAVLEVFAVAPDGSLTFDASVPVGLEPVTVAARNDTEVWVANHLSDSVSIVDLTLRETVRTLAVGDEPTDVVFAGNRAFVAVSQEDAVKVFDLGNLDAAPQVIPLAGVDIRALAVTPNGQTVYAIPMHSGNKTTVVSATVIASNTSGLLPGRLFNLGLNDLACASPPPPYPPLPPGITRNPALTDPPDGVPRVSLIVRFNDATGQWEDEIGQNWNPCLPFRLTDLDLFEINAATLQVTTRPSFFSLGTTLFDVSVKPDDGRIYVPHTEARNQVRFDHPLGLGAHTVDNRLAVVDPTAGTRTIIELNAHIDRQSNPAANLAEREASMSQPGMMAWRSDGSAAYLSVIGSRKVFRVDGACTSPTCIVGPNRATPDAVVVGEGPTGVAFLESAERLYVLNRFSNSIAVVDTTAFLNLGEIALPDPSPVAIKQGRRLLYDGIATSGHGDASCASCHVSGDSDFLAWDLGDPAGSLAPYTLPFDNIRFVEPTGTGPVPPRPCDPIDPTCTPRQGFDPQKGPMFTQSLRGMLEPLHWRGDKPTMRDFNAAFVTLLGAADIGPINGHPGALSAADIDTFRTFTMGLRFPPNPFRNVNDTLVNATVDFPAFGFAGNPANGQVLFNTRPVFGPDTCISCHAGPFGSVGGRLGGVEPTEPTSLDATALMEGVLGEVELSHFDIEVPHLRNLYEKLGPRFGNGIGTPPSSSSTGFGFTHDGSIPNVTALLSTSKFVLTAPEVRDIAAFLLNFPTETRPAVGRTVTVPPGAAPTGSLGEEALLATLVTLGDVNNANRHCDLVAATRHSGRPRRFHLFAGLWRTDRISEASITTASLRTDAQGRISFLCAPIGSGPRLGGDRDVDGFRDGDDNCPMTANPLQSDSNGNGIGDACDPTSPPTTTSSTTSTSTSTTSSTSTSTTSSTANGVPVVTITSPGAGTPSFLQGSPVTFVAGALDPEQGNLTTQLVWTSSIDGTIGTGASFVRTNLSLGTHLVTARVTDGGGATGTATVLITIVDPSTPQTVTFTSIAAEDGNVVEAGETQNVGAAVAATNGDLRVGDQTNDAQFKGFLSFDTSSLPDNVAVTSAVVSLRRFGVQGANPFDSLGALQMDVQSGGFGGNTALEAGDFQATATAVAVGTLSNATANGAVSTGAFNATGRAAVNRVGTTQVRLAFALDDNDNLTQDVMRYVTGENADPAQRPTLTITFIGAAPTVDITQPADATGVFVGTPITFTATATDPDEGNLAAQLAWTSSLDGPIGNGASFTTSSLSAGVHVVTASVTDATGATGSDVVTVQVSPASSTTQLTFTSIAVEDGDVVESGENTNIGNITANNATTFRLGDSVQNRQFRGVVSFDTQAIPDGAVVQSATLRLRRQAIRGTNPFTTFGNCVIDVRSGGFSGNTVLEVTDFQAAATAAAAGTMSVPATDGSFSTGALNAAGLAAINKTGTTQIRLAFTLDDNNNLVQDQVLFNAAEEAVADRRPQLIVTYLTGVPTVTITAPADGGTFPIGGAVVFSGTASDAEDGNITPLLGWSSDRDGTIGSGGTFSIATLSPGVHTITARATDTSGQTGSASITLTMATGTTSTSTSSTTSTSLPAPPVVTISQPADGAAIAQGVPITFAASAVDARDGDVSAGLAWTSSLDGPIGTGASFVGSTLSVGSHTITTSVTDSDGLTGVHAIALQINPANTPVTLTFASRAPEDGGIIESNATSGVGGIVSDVGTDIQVGDHNTNGQSRGFVSFDTSAIPDGAFIQSATLRMRRVGVLGTNPFLTHGACRVDVVTGSFGGNAALQASDFQAAATVTAAGALSAPAANGDLSSATLDPAGAAAINKTGLTQFRIAFELEDNGNGVIDRMRFGSAENATATNRPELVVTFVE